MSSATKPKAAPRVPRVHASFLIPTGVDVRLAAMAVASGKSKSELVTAGIELVHNTLSDKEKDATSHVEEIIGSRGEPPPPPPASTKRAG